MNSNMQIPAQDVIDIVTSQRNAAMDEVVRQAVIIKVLEREIDDLKKDYDIPPDKRSGDLFTGLDGLRSVERSVG